MAKCASEQAMIRYLSKRRISCPSYMHARGILLNAQSYARKGQCKTARRGWIMAIFRRCRIST